MRTWLRRVLWGLPLGLILAQAIPVSRTAPDTDPARSLYANAAVPADVRSLLERSCADCHSNATTWPWYSRVAPLSWLVSREVQLGRRALNLDEWDSYSAGQRERKLEQICEQVSAQDMSDGKHLRIHDSVKLTDVQRATLCQWADATHRSLATPGLPSRPEQPAWCRALPRPEYRPLERVGVSDPWFEVYRVATGVFAIYEPHQAEEVISYLIVGAKQAALFDTGMGISDIQKVTAELTALPIVVLNSHTHHDHVGGNWQFKDVLGVDTAFTRASARGTTAGAQDELGPDMICGALPSGFDARSYATRPWTITRWIHDGDRLDLGDRVLEILATPGHTPDAVCLLDRQHGLLFTGDTYYPAPIWLFRPETDLDAYATSVRRLAPLTSHLVTVLGAHNVPIAPPQILPRLVSAFDDVRSGRVQPTREQSKNTYSVGEISFVLRATLP
jgi:glyoxylase-like metal-dependent hydrolase (beta-lactamase superfamily II)